MPEDDKGCILADPDLADLAVQALRASGAPGRNQLGQECWSGMLGSLRLASGQ
jgi:hypothetical protein